MTTAEQMREKAKANQIELVRTAINEAVAGGHFHFHCERNGKLTNETLAFFRKEGFVIHNGNIGFYNYWEVNW